MPPRVKEVMSAQYANPSGMEDKSIRSTTTQGEEAPVKYASESSESSRMEGTQHDGSRIRTAHHGGNREEENLKEGKMYGTSGGASSSSRGVEPRDEKQRAHDAQKERSGSESRTETETVRSEERRLE